jgi:CDGSH-type Zn-finger protein
VDGEMRIKVTEDGPYLVTGDVPIAEQTIGTDADGESETWLEGEPLHRHAHQALCRCGSSHAKPFCDGTHVESGFDGTETASHEPYDEQADVIEGPVVGLRDAVALCADARFCHRKRIWRLVGAAEELGDVEAVHHDAGLCPSGRYTALHPRSGLSRTHRRGSADRCGSAAASRSNRPTGSRTRPVTASRCAGAAPRRTSRSATDRTSRQGSRTRSRPRRFQRGWRSPAGWA